MSAFEKGAFGDLMAQVRRLDNVRRVAFFWDVTKADDALDKWRADAWVPLGLDAYEEQLVRSYGRTGEEAFRGLVAALTQLAATEAPGGPAAA